MAALIYAPAIALLAAMRLDPQWFWPLVLAIGLSCTLYSTFGGIRGIIVTDALQMTIIFVALGLTLAFIGRNLPLSPGEVWQSLRQSGHLGDWSLSFSLTRLSVWAVLCGVTLNSIGSYVGDQMSLQRYMTASSLDEAKRSFLVNLVGVLVVVLTLCAIGLALTAWYQGLPPDRAPARPDDVLPLFVATELPAGIAGLILAAILAATMSSMSSGINALAASLNMDFRRGASSPGESPQSSLRNARLLSLAIGLASTVSAGLVFHLGHLFDIAQRILGVFMAPLAMVLLLAVTPWRLRPHRVAAGLAAGSVAGGFVALTPNLAAVFPAVPPVHSLWVAVAASLVTLTVCLSGLEGRCKPARAGSRP
jgi:Na+/proline symporter